MLVRMLSNKNSHSLVVGMQNGIAFWKTIWGLLTKPNTLIPHDPATELLGIYTELKTYVYTKTTQGCL